MILVCGGIKGGVGKSTLATNLTVIRAAQGFDVRTYATVTSTGAATPCPVPKN